MLLEYTNSCHFLADKYKLKNAQTHVSCADVHFGQHKRLFLYVTLIFYIWKSSISWIIVHILSVLRRILSELFIDFEKMVDGVVYSATILLLAI